MEPTAFDLCIDLYGNCSCSDQGRAPCAAMIDMAASGMSAQDERDRMEEERAAIADEDAND